jgi:virginiamycin B lyase
MNVKRWDRTDLGKWGARVALATVATVVLAGCGGTTPTLGGGGTVATGGAGGATAENASSQLEKCSQSLGTLAVVEDQAAPWYRTLTQYRLGSTVPVLRMMINQGAQLPPDQVEPLREYLTRSFPEKPKPAGVVIPGPANVSFKEWQVPTPGSRPHDPLAAKDGSIWYTGQLSNKLGKLTPGNAQFKEFELKSPRTGPHGLADDKDGNIWFTGNSSGVIGKLDPKTGNVIEYKMPDPAVRDPHTPNFDQSGILWFTAQNANVMGRLDPSTGEFKIIKSLTANSRPYGLHVNSKGVPVVVLFGTNKIATIDPRTLDVKEYVLPNANSRPRRLALADDNTVYYADYSRGFLGRLDLANGQVKEWASPSGPQSQPYGIAFAKGAIWYNESFAKPNTLVRFDPKSESFQTWPFPGGGDIVRNMDVTAGGNVVTANSLVNQIGFIEIR